jgi:anti-sigma B factor antagonist
MSAMAEEDHFRVTYDGEVTVVHVDALPPDNVGCPWANPLVEFVEQHKPTKLVVDFEAVAKFPSVAIGALLRVDKRVRAYSGQLRLAGMRPDVREVFKITRLDGSVFQILDSCRLARESFDS